MHATFVNLSNIIQVQQEYVDRLEESANQAHDATRSGLINLKQAQKKQSGCAIS